MEYLLIDIGAVSVPFIYSFHSKLGFNEKWKAFALAVLISSIPFLIWDSIFTFNGVWGFTPDYLIGVDLFSLPLEEYLFFLCIPYACVFTYHCFSKIWFKSDFVLFGKYVMNALILLMSISAILYYDRQYTFITSVGFLGLLLFLKFYARPKWIGRFFMTYSVLLIPFVIVNGFLTGTGFDTPIVWYNDAENIGFRLLSIPVEDVFYGMFLVLLIVTLYEKFNERFEQS